MDYFGMPHCASHMNPETPYIDIPSLRAAIPGSGDEKVAWTYTHDVARYVRALIESAEPWPKTSLIVGDTMSLNAIVSIAEEIKGKSSLTSAVSGMGEFVVDVYFCCSPEIRHRA